MYTENALVGEVIIQEKIDGSQFGFGLNDDGKPTMRSKGVLFSYYDDMTVVTDTMFKKAVEHINSKKDILLNVPHDSYFYCEYLQKPKHNTLKYDHTPTNHLVLFDAMIGGMWATREQLIEFATKFEIDVIPELYRGVADVEKVKSLLTTQSYLGNEIVEGVVIKNYEQKLTLGGHIIPLFTKYVREEFKERHWVDWKANKTEKGSVEKYIESFKNEARWQKAIMHLEEQGKLEHNPRDIGPLIKEIQEDIETEETENIKNFLLKTYLPQILRKSVSRFPEHYKNKLLENLNPSIPETK